MLRTAAMALLLAGCAESSGSGAGLVQTTQDTATKFFDASKRSAQDMFQGGDKPRKPRDKYCESLEQSYDMVDNLAALMVTAGSASLLSWQRGGYQPSARNSKDLDNALKEVSKDHLWMPVAIEQQIGTAKHKEFPEDKIVKRGQGRRARTMYDKADKALAAAVKDYPKMPYELSLHIVEGDVVNAEALPAGYVYVTTKAALELDPEALQLVLGHEVAHVAKRHTSKQLQQRIVDTGAGVDMMKHVIQGGNVAAPQSVFAGWGILKKLEGKFARYDQEQELEADACSIRALVRADIDPIKARKEYLRKRGTEAKRSEAASAPAKAQDKLFGFTEHPDDEARERFFVEATNFNRASARRPPSAPGPGQAEAAPPSVSKPAAAAATQDAKPSVAVAACAKLEPEKAVRSDAEPPFTKLSLKDRQKLQRALCLKDKDVDGHWGPKTKHSLKQYECRIGHEPDGKLTDAMAADLLKLSADDIAKQCKE